MKCETQNLGQCSEPGKKLLENSVGVGRRFENSQGLVNKG